MRLLRWLDVLDLYVAASGDIEEIDHLIPPDSDDIFPTLHRAQVGVAQPPRRIRVERPCDVNGASIFELDLHPASFASVICSRRRGIARVIAPCRGVALGGHIPHDSANGRRIVAIDRP
jgi:hypothetical protein